MFHKLKSTRPSPELIIGSIGGLVAIILALLFANFYINQAKGANPPITISFSPPSGNIPVGQPQEISMFIQTDNAQNYIEGFDITLNASGNTTFVSTQAPELVGVSNPAVFQEIIKNVSANQVRLSYVTLESDPSMLPTQILIRLTIQGNTEGAGGITVNTASSSVVGNNIAGTAYDLTNIGSGSYTFTTSTPSFWLVPSTQSVNTNDTFDVEVHLSTGTSEVSAADAVINFDTTYLSVTNVVPSTDPNSFTTYAGIGGTSNYVDAVNGRIKISGQIETDVNPTTVSGSDIVFATITFQALQPIAQTNVLFDFALNNTMESNIVEYPSLNDILADVGDGTYTISDIVPTATPIPPTSTPVPTGVPTPTNTPTPTQVPPTATPVPPTATPLPTATPVPPTATPIPTVAPQSVAVNLSLLLEGRTLNNKNDRNVRLTIEETGFTTTAANTNTAGDALNVSLGTLVPGSYTLRVKPVGYLSRTFPLTVTSAGVYDVDFGQTQFLAGDISVVEDDIVNALDYSRLLTNFFSQGLAIDLFDLNGDTVVNGVDFSYMLRNWSPAQP